MKHRTLSSDTQATLLICGHFSSDSRSGVEPLHHDEYNNLARILRDRGMRPTDLLGFEEPDQFAELTGNALEHQRLWVLFQRGAALALAVESWTNQGGSILGRSDTAYPEPLLTRLGINAPPLLYCTGNLALLNQYGLAISGVSDVDRDGCEFARDLASLCGQQQLQVISGVDSAAEESVIQTALASGSNAIGIVSGRLGQKSISREWRKHLNSGAGVLVSSSPPEASSLSEKESSRFGLVFSLASWVMMVDKGFSGNLELTNSKENKNAEWPPMFVRSDQGLPPTGALQWGSGFLPYDESLLASRPHVKTQLDTIHVLYSQAGMYKDNVQDELPEHEILSEPAEGPSEFSMDQLGTTFDRVWPVIRAALIEPRSRKELADEIKVRPGQLDDWLRIALERGYLEQTRSDRRRIALKGSNSISQAQLFTEQ